MYSQIKFRLVQVLQGLSPLHYGVAVSCGSSMIDESEIDIQKDGHQGDGSPREDAFQAWWPVPTGWAMVNRPDEYGGWGGRVSRTGERWR